MHIIQIIADALPKTPSFSCIPQYMDLSTSTMKPPIVVMMIHVHGLAALNTKKYMFVDQA